MTLNIDNKMTNSMKKTYRSLLLLTMAAVLPALFTACEDDNGSNPTVSVPQSFTLNNADMAQNIYDLPYGTVNLTASQPDYGGWPASVTYAVQASLSGNDGTWSELPTTYPTPTISIDGTELNSYVLTEYRTANNEADPEPGLPVYLRLRAFLTDTDNGYAQVYSNPVSIKVYSWEAPVELSLPTDYYVCGNSIGDAWSTWKPLAPVYDKEGRFYTMIYNNGDGFKWGNKPNDWFGYDMIDAFDIQANGLEVSSDGDGNIVFSKAGWYVLKFTAAIDGKKVKNTLGIYDAQAFVIGAGAGGDWTDCNPEWEMLPGDDNIWVSPEFTGAGEMRAYIHVPGEDWWRTEFTLFEGTLYWRTVDIPQNWKDNVGEDYSVSVGAGQKLYVNFDRNTGEVK